jgi:uncharacterized protein
MKWIWSLPACLLLFLTACNQQQAATPTAAIPVAAEPPAQTNAQPRLVTMKLYLGAKELTAELALDDASRMAGMMFRTNMPSNEGMLFVFPGPHRTGFWMKNTPLPLSAAYIDPDGIIQELHDFQPFNTNSVLAAKPNIQYVLEVNQGWFKEAGISVGTKIRTERGELRETFHQVRP